MVIKFEFHYPEEYRTSSFYDYYGFFRKLDYGYLYCFLSDIKRDTVIADFFDFTGQRINHIELQVKDCLPPSMWIYVFRGQISPVIDFTGHGGKSLTS